MYGTIARFTLKPGSYDEFAATALAQGGEAIPGHLSTTVLRADANPDECWIAVVFADRDAYQQNANDPAQHERYLQLARFFAADPQWHDGEIAFSATGTPTPPAR